jgi:DNA polymerase V
MLALADCRNFYARCHQVFRPDLENKPIVVLSNNDGCIIARSQEAKSLGYKMGDPFFAVHKKLQNDNVEVFSSQYALYGDMSSRVMTSLEELAPALDVYSIDEAFLSLAGINDLQEAAANIKSSVYQWTGMVINIGIAPTKTLCKIASTYAKSEKSKDGIYILDSPPYPLDDIPVRDIWGIGRQLSKQLVSMGIETAAQLQQLDARQARQRFNVVVERIVRELQGVSCIPFSEAPPHPQNIMVSRGFKGRVTSGRHLAEAVALYASRAGEKAREKKVYSCQITLFIKTSPFSDGPKYSNTASYTFNEPRNDSSGLVSAAMKLLKRIYRPGFEYQKAGIMLTGLVYAHERQASLFGRSAKANNDRVMKAVDKLNNKFGRETIRVASSGYQRPWWMARERLCPCYTTRWEDILTVEN